ncbi:MAG: PAS domain-containing sensor histidine kinase [Cytophagia bacterium]|nr:MAG: PAS domain-containing sensor histidine kinase [Cytophagales bacterium]TAG40919.1 MAG: PAS domain-containing sensor histidine kinase [Cytophagia bacterium]TAG74319.1 MAG: PAS domain-containing sensor histidine kinase [Runella slithyformis]TAG82546.1 MAG: PAS domain-containing sensor histidine kinase [Cytophagales bacterium]
MPYSDASFPVQPQQNDQPFEALFRYAAMGIVLVNKAGVILRTNLFANQLFGYPEYQLEGQMMEVLIPVSLRHKHQQQRQHYAEHPQVRPMGVGLDLKAQHKDGSLFSVEISLSFFVQDNEPYFIAFVNDTTLQKEAETAVIQQKNEIEKLNQNLEKEVVNRTKALVETLERLETSKKALEQALEREKELGELKSRFVSMASHEFRTPLTSILSAANLVEKYVAELDQDKRERHLRRIKTAVSNLTDILEEFLSVGKLEEGKIEPRLLEFDLTTLIAEVQLDLQAILRPRQQFICKHTGPELCCTDPSLLRKIIINLVSNACKFSPEGSLIQLQTCVSKAQLTLQVSDTGIGISDEDQKYLFDRFFRGSNVTNVQGTGLGLHIVARYAQLLNGSVRIDSQLGKGTTVTIIFKTK